MADRDPRPAGARSGARLARPRSSIVTTTFKEGAERTKALGVWAAIAVGGGAVGLVLGGVLVETSPGRGSSSSTSRSASSRSSSRCRFVPESRDEHAHRSFDVAGAVDGDRGLIALVYGIVRSAESGWGSGEVLGILALAAVLLVAFVVIERRSAEPLVRLSIFSVRTVRGATSRCSSSRWGSSRCSSSTRSSSSACSATRRSRRGSPSFRSRPGSSSARSLSQQLIPRLGAREVPDDRPRDGGRRDAAVPPAHAGQHLPRRHPARAS